MDDLKAIQPPITWNVSNRWVIQIEKEKNMEMKVGQVRNVDEVAGRTFEEKILASACAGGFLLYLFLPSAFDWIGFLLVVLATVWAGPTYGKALR